MSKKTIMVDMDEVIVIGRFSKFFKNYLGDINSDNLNAQINQDLIKSSENEFQKSNNYKNLYKYKNGRYIKPLPNCIDVIKKLNQTFDVNIVTSYVWKENIVDTATNLKNKYEYLRHWFPFIDPNNFIFIRDKNKIKYDIGIDDRISNLQNCTKKLLFTEFRNKNLSKEELEKNNVIRVNNWLDIERNILN